MSRSCSEVTRLRLMATVAIVLTAIPALAQRQMEKLGRGVIAVRTGTSSVYISWRLLATDPDNIGFNLLRCANGITNQVNSQFITNTTDCIDASVNFAVSNAWFVQPVASGVAQALSAPWVLPNNAPTRQYFSVPLAAVTNGAAPPYDVKFCWVGDLDGDGEYDFVVDRLSTTVATNQYLQAYKRDGTFLWQMDMGYNSTNQYNIEPGASAISVGDKDNVTVYDFDGDGYAEVAVRTARGVILPDGTTITGPDDTTQYLSILNGLTGRELARVTLTNLWPSDGPMNFRMGVMYCDGVHPSLIMEGENRHGSGAFQREAMAFDYRNGQLTRRWFFTPPDGSNLSWSHQIRISDVNHDGIDELLDIGSARTGAGATLYDTELLHGDRFHVMDIDPDHPGLETFAIQQDNPTLLATALFESGTGRMLKKWYSGGVADVARGIALDMDPTHRGCEMYSTQPGIFDCKGNQIYVNNLWAPEGVWWDADLSREFEDGAGSGAPNPVINKFNPTTGGVDRIYSIYSDGGGYQVHQAYGGRAAFWGDILGDWREELVLVANDYSEIRIYTTKLAARNRLYCLMQNPQYRDEATTKGYYEANYVDYYLGNGMPPPPPPPVSNAKLVWRGDGTNNVWDAATAANWLTNWFYVGNANTHPAAFNAGDTVLFDLTGSNNTAITLAGSLTPGDVRVHSPKDYTFGGSGSLAGAMGLTKAGAGRLIFSGTNTYTGATLIAEGPFVVNGALPNSPVTVRGGVWLDGRLGGTGVVGSTVSIYEGAGVSPGAGTNSPGTLTLATNLLLGGRTLNDFDLSNDPTGATNANDSVVVNGNLILQGTNTLVIHLLNANLAAGNIYPLITYAGTLTGSLANLTVSGLSGIPFALTNPPGKIALLVKSFRAPATISWTGGNGGNAWDLMTTANWLNGGVKDMFAPSDTVRFDSTGVSNLTVSLVGDLNAANITVDSPSNYVFTGSGAIIGSGGLLKTNSGTLTISNANNTFTGKTTIAGGTLAVSEMDAVGFPSPIGNPPADATNLILSGNATLRVLGESYTDRGVTLNTGTNSIDVTNSSDQLTMAGVIAGGGALQKLGAGTLALTGSNAYTGATYIRGGSVSFGGDDANQYGCGPGPGGNGNTTITLENAALRMFSDSGSYNHTYWNLIVPTNSSGTFYADDRCYLHGTLTGGGAFNFNVNYVRTELDGNWSAFAGQINVTTGGSGDFRINNSYGYGNAGVDIGNYVYAYHMTSGSAVSLGSLSGGTYSHLSGTAWTVGAKNADSTYAGNISGNSLTKVGTGTLTLTGNTNTYTGTTTVSLGTLQIGSGGTSGTIGAGNITDNATLAFNRSDFITDTNFGVISGTGNLAKRGAGRLALTKAHTCSGATTVEAGTLALTNSGSIANSSNIVISAGALFDVSGTTGGSMTLASGKMISGNGSVKGNFTVGDGAFLSPGTNGIGTLNFSNALALAGTSTNLFEIRKTPLTNDVAKIHGPLTNGGVLIVTNIGAVVLSNGDSFKLFNAASYSGAFAKVILPSLPVGLGWNTNALNTTGTISVIVAAKPFISAISMSTGSLGFSGTGGIANANFYLLGATNISQPISNWARLLTNQFDQNGYFDFSCGMDTNAQNFYRLQLQ